MTKVLTAAYSDDEYTQAQILDMDDHLDIYSRMIACDPLSDTFPDTTLEILTLHPPNDYFEAGSMIVVSDRLKTVLQSEPVRAEFIPLRILYQKRDYTHERFYFCHVLEQVDCIDVENGICTFHDKPGFRDHIKEISTLAIDEAKASTHHLFRIAKGAEYIVCVGDSLANRISESGLTGMRLLEPKDWQFGC